jgi:hypothetical protein
VVLMWVVKTRTTAICRSSEDFGISVDG